MPRMSSTSCMRGTGFMKWMPMNCSGSLGDRGEPRDRDRGRIGADDRVGFEERSQTRENLALDLLVLGGRLDDEIAIAERVLAGRGRNAPERRRARPSSSICPLAIWRANRPLIVASAARSPLLGDVVDDDLEACLRANLRDAAAHLAGPDHAYFIDCKRHFLIPQRWAPATRPAPRTTAATDASAIHSRLTRCTNYRPILVSSSPSSGSAW